MTTEYIDTKAKGIAGFDLIANIMWRRAKFLLDKKFNNLNGLLIIDPCAGGGKLLSSKENSYSALGYEPDYSRFVYLKAMLDELPGPDQAINSPFEFHFSGPHFPVYHLAISIPYTDRIIDPSLEKDIDCLKCKNYAFYVLNRSLDILVEGGFGIFALPKNMVDKELFSAELEHITEKANIMSIESYGEYAIIVLQKDKIK